MTTNLDDASIFLTGGTGFLGRHLRERFAASGAAVTLLVRPESSVSPRDNETVVRGDVTESGQFGIEHADIVCHLAAQTDIGTSIENPVSTWQVNATGTLHVLEAARTAEVDRFLVTSTASIYGPPEYLPIDETHPMNPAEPYGASKLSSDRLAYAYGNTYGFDVVIARLFNLYGPGQPTHNVVGHIIEQALDSDVVELGNLYPSRDFLYISDAIDALVRLLVDGRPGEAYNVGSGSETRIGTLAEKISLLVDDEPDVVSVPSRQRDDDVEIERHVAATDKLRSLGWEPSTPLEEGLHATVEAFKEERGD